MRVGFVGLGIMGRGMAANLVRAGHEVMVYNRTAVRAEPLTAQGARLAASPAEVTAFAEITGVCVTDDAAVRALLTGPQGLIAGLRPGHMIADHSTISPAQTRLAAEAVAAAGGEWLDAPVTGGDRGAAEGTLTIMVGGSELGYQRLTPYLRAIGRTLVHVGASGSGQMAKLVNNFIGGIALVAAAEGLFLAQNAGIPPADVAAALAAGPADSVSLRLLAERLHNGNDQPGFSLANRLKDMDLALAAARALKLPAPLGALAAECFRERLAAGEGDLDQTVVARRNTPL